MKVNKILTDVGEAALMTPVLFTGGPASSMPPLPPWTHSRMNLLTLIITFLQRMTKEKEQENMGRLEGNVAFITGAGRGIGARKGVNRWRQRLSGWVGRA